MTLPGEVCLRRSLALIVLAGSLVAGCATHAGGAHAKSSGMPARRLPSDDAAIAHLLSRVTYGARPGDIERVRQVGVQTYIEGQLHPERLPDAEMEHRLASFETLTLSSQEIVQSYLQPAQDERRLRQQALAVAAQAPGSQATGAQPARPAQPAPEPEVFRRERLVVTELPEARLLRAIYSDRQLQEELVDFWFNHFNVFAGKGADRGLLTAYERDTIRPRVLGRFRDLLGATAESPAMLFYLDNWLSVDPNGPHPAARPAVIVRGGAARGRGLAPPLARPAPQPARPAAQAARRGLNENYGRELMELHTLGVDGGYTQKDVIEVARCFTGWTIAQPRDGGGFRFDERIHDEGQKVVLGHVIKPGGGKSDGDQVLDILAGHPSTARFIATKIVRRFVSDTPPPALVDRVAARFRETDGDLREVMRTILMSPEFWASTSRGAKVKTPLEFVASAMRVTDARVERATSLVQALRNFGMPLYYCQPPTGYVDNADAWINTGGLLARMNFALALVENRLPGIHVDVTTVASGTDPAATRDLLVQRILGPAASEATAATIARAKTAPQMAALALGAPEFQKR